MIKVLVVGQSPPPHHGQAIAIERIVAGQYRDVLIRHVPMRFSRKIGDVGRFQFGKLLELMRVILLIYYYRLTFGPQVLYYPPAGPQRVPVYRDMIILLATRWMFRRTVFHFHACGLAEIEPKLSRPARLLFRWAYHDADAAIRSSTLIPNDGERLGSQREYIVPLGVEDHGERTTLPSSNIPTILLAGIVSENKGVLVFLNACGKLARNGHAFRVDVLGDFESQQFKSRVHQLLGELALVDRIHFHGVVTGQPKHELIAAADLLCFPSHHPTETFGLVVVEAMSHGLPVVATRWRAVPSIVVEGQTGLLVEPGDDDALAAALETLVTSRELRRQMGERSRRRYLEEFTAERYVSRIEHAFLEVAAL